MTDIEFERQKEECKFAPTPIATKNLAGILGKSTAAILSQRSPRTSQIFQKRTEAQSALTKQKEIVKKNAT